MELADNLSLILRYVLVVLFFVYYALGLVLSSRLPECDVRRQILRGAHIPLLVVVLIACSMIWFRHAKGPDVLTAFSAVVVCSILGAIAFSLWLERGGGRQMLYVPLAFRRFGWRDAESAAYAVADLSSDDPQYGSDLLLSYLPLVLMALTLALIVWDVSRGAGA